MRKEKNMFQIKGPYKAPDKNFHETEISNLPDKQFKVWSLRCSLISEEVYMNTERTSTKKIYKNTNKSQRAKEYIKLKTKQNKKHYKCSAAYQMKQKKESVTYKTGQWNSSKRETKGKKKKEF